jgi:DNA repair protein RadA/Sms
VALVPKANMPKKSQLTEFEGLTVHPVQRMDEAMDLVRSLSA